MIKFEDVNSHELEIARAFDTPARMYLNRPLIMLLEQLGVKASAFMKLQRTALDDVHKAAGSLETAAKLLESHGLGTAYNLPSLFISLHKLRSRDAGIAELLQKDDFFRRVLDFAINSIRRELKYKARIPVPQSWTLVGVVDVHNYLKEGEIFGARKFPDQFKLLTNELAACVKSRDSQKFYLEGPVLITRSPVIHPGDVQMVHAIGRPPTDSPFIHEDLPNCVVFSIRGGHTHLTSYCHVSLCLGDRSLGSCLGGGARDQDCRTTDSADIPVDLTCRRLRRYVCDDTHSYLIAHGLQVTFTTSARYASYILPDATQQQTTLPG